MKKILIVTLALALLSGCTNAKDSGTVSNDDPSVVSPTLKEDVKIVIPKSFYEDTETELTQEFLNENCDTTKLRSCKILDSGDVEYVVIGEEHQNLINEMKVNVEVGIEEMLSSMENVSEIKFNLNLTTFDIVLKSNEIGLYEGFASFLLIIQGQFYQMFNGTPDSVITVNYIGTDGKVIESTDSNKLAEGN